MVKPICFSRFGFTHGFRWCLVVKKLKRAWALSAALAVVIAIALAAQPIESVSTKPASPSNAAVSFAKIAKVPDNPDAYVAGELIVGLDDAGEVGERSGETLSLVSERLGEAGLALGEILAPASADSGSIVLLTARNGQGDQLDLQQAEKAIAAILGISFVQPNYRYTAASTEAETAIGDVDAGKQWYLNSWDGDASARGANVVAAWELLEGRDLAPVDVAVLDTGAYSMPYEAARVSENNATWNGEAYFAEHGGYDPSLFHQEFGADNLDMNHGIDFVHRDDGGHLLWDGPIVNSYNPYGDDNGHGTHVSAIIAAHASTGDNPSVLPLGMAGISQTARIVPMKVLDGSGAGTTADFIRAYSMLINKKSDGTLPNLRIVNMSFALTEETDDEEDANDSIGGQSAFQAASLANGLAGEGDADGAGGGSEEEDDDPAEPPEGFTIEMEDEDTGSIVEQSNIALQSVISRAAENGIVTVCAAGNEGSTAATSPADLRECISVTALDKDGQDAQYSNRNAKSDISAPGTDIYSAWASQADAYRTLSGTSQAAAVVSGVLSLLWSANPNLSIDQVKEAVYRSAHEESNTSPDVNGSFGAIDAAAALEYVLADSWQGIPKKRIDENDPDDPVSLLPAQVSLDDTLCVYTGKALTPEVSVMLGDEELEQDDDFTVRYVDNINPGTAKAIVTGAGAYTGTKTVSFTIALGQVEISKLKAAKRAFVVTWARQQSGNVGYQIRYSTKKSMNGSSLKTVAKNKTTKLKVKKAGKKKLKRKKRYFVQVRTYKTIGKRTYYSAWSSKRSVKTK